MQSNPPSTVQCVLLERFVVEKLIKPSELPVGFTWRNAEWLLMVESEHSRAYVERVLKRLKRSGRVHEMRRETLSEDDFSLLGFSPFGSAEIVIRPPEVSIGIKWLTGWIVFLTFFVLPSCVAVIKAAPLLLDD